MLEKCIKDYVASVEASVAHQPPNQTKLIKMKSIILVALALVAVAVAVPVEQVPIEILKSTFEQNPEGSYNYAYEAANGIVREETGELKQVLDEEKKPHNVVVTRGSYSYPDEQGKPISVQYYADETGYHAEGDSIPKPARR